jgi:CcmD family protein
MKVLSLIGLFLVSPIALHAQTMGAALGNQNLRGYTHMFIAYAIAWLLVIGWVISIARRLGRVERALKD